jgi:hypothetical protein
MTIVDPGSIASKAKLEELKQAVAARPCWKPYFLADLRMRAEISRDSIPRAVLDGGDAGWFATQALELEWLANELEKA